MARTLKSSRLVDVCAGGTPQTSTKARGRTRLVFHFEPPERPNSALSPAKKLHTTRSGSEAPRGTDRLAFGGPRLSEQAYSLTWKTHLRDLSSKCLSLGAV